MSASQSDFNNALDSSMEDLRQRYNSGIVSARAAERREVTAQLNNAVRRLRQSDSPNVWVRTLLDAVAPFCAQAACFRLEGNRVLLDGTSDAELEPVALEFELDRAPAFANAAESMDVVVTAAAASQLSDDVLTLLQPKGQKLYLFPLVCHGRTTAILAADPGEAEVDVSALELLSAVASQTMAEPARPEPIATAAGLIRIEGALATPPKASASLRPEWADLTKAEQETHLRAQRFSRTKVAEMLLNKMEKVRQGRASNDLYGTLRIDIDAGRETFRRQFVHTCPSMVDYFHLELVRTLAQDDADRLGPEYPGPLP